MKDFYIKPKVKYYSSFSEANEDLKTYSHYFLDDIEDIEFNDLFSKPKNFIISEPGFGKTRLLREIIKQSTKLGKQGVYVDLKMLQNNSNIEQYLKSKIKDFKLQNSGEIAVCLDALDEVQQSELSKILDNIKNFLEKYDKVFIFISCRWHYFQKYEDLFLDWKFRYTKIFPFSRQQTNDYLINYSFKENQIKEIFNILTFQNRNLVIQTPRYLELLAQYKKKISFKKVVPSMRAKIFDYFIYKNLETEDKKYNTQNRDVIKSTLEKLALVMETKQTNIISREDLMIFFDDLKSDLKNILLNKIGIAEFIDKTALNETDGIIEFQNTEFQEYLAAKEIIRLGNPQQIIYDLAVDKNFKDIYPSWFNTLGFVVELKSDFLKFILDFVFNDIEIKYINESYFQLLSNADIGKLSLNERKEIFEKIFLHYQKVLHHIKWDIAKNLALCFDNSFHNLLKEYIEKKKYNSETEKDVQIGNVVQLIETILKLNILSQRECVYWKNRIIKYAVNKNIGEVVRINSIEALSAFKDENIIKKLEIIWDDANIPIKQSFLSFCSHLNPNNLTSLEYFIKGISSNRGDIIARNAIYKIKDEKTIYKLIKYFSTNENFLYNFLEHERTFKDKDPILIQNIEAVLNDKIVKEVKKIVIAGLESKNYYILEHSSFLHNLIKIIKNKDKNYLNDIIDEIFTSEVIEKPVYLFASIFQNSLIVQDVENFINKCDKQNEGLEFAEYVLYNIQFTQNPERDKIYKKAKSFFSKEFKKREENHKKQLSISQNEEIKDKYVQFKLKLEPCPGKYSNDVFRFYILNKEYLKDIITVEDKNRLIDLIIGMVFAKFKDPANAKFKILNRNNGNTKYSIDGTIPIIGDALLISQDFNIKIEDGYRQKIINFIPFAYDNHRQAIFKLIDNITQNELTKLLKIYKEKKSDKWRFLPDSLIETTQHYNLKEAVPILKMFISLKELNIYERCKALEVVANIEGNLKFIKKIFNSFIKSKIDKETELGYKANELLISVFEDKDAIKWRFEQIKKRSFKYKRIYGIHSTSDNEEEMLSKKFAKPLAELKGKEYEIHFKSLLLYSFKKLQEDGLYYSYADYLWQISSQYYSNLKETRDYNTLIELEKFINKNANIEGVNWFGYKLKELRIEYLNYIGKSITIADSIKQYNFLKRSRYLNISSTFDLLKTVEDVITNEISNWITGEGVKMMENKNEPEIQKILKFLFENTFLKRGFRENEISLLREAQLQSDKRTDFIISYGFVKPVIVEIKLSNHKDLPVTRDLIKKESYQSMEHYMKSYNVEYGIFFVINNG